MSLLETQYNSFPSSTLIISISGLGEQCLMSSAGGRTNTWNTQAAAKVFDCVLAAIS